MKTFKRVTLKNLLLLLCGLALALQTTGCRQEESPADASQEKDQPHKPGPGEGGGGDPDSQRFIFLSLKLARYYAENPANLDLPFSPADFAATVDHLDNSLKDPAKTDLVSFTQAQLMDQNGVPKVALFHRASGSIQINRAYWSSASDEDKFVMIHMEIAGLLGIDVRYEQALSLIKDRAALIFAMPISDAGESTPIGWWIANQDPNLFSRISANDALIDGGVIGTGTAANQRIVEFLKNPEQDNEWYSLAESAFSKGLPAYLMLRDADGKRASLTAFRKTNTGFPTYSLLFYAKSTPVGQCEHNSTNISSLERIKNCFFDTRFYQTGDAQSVFSELSARLTRHYAYSTDTLENALQFYLIQDYSGLFTPQFRTYVLIKTAQAHGLKPHLTKNDVAFWQQTSEMSEDDLRFYKALQRMAQDRVGFYPGQHPQCIYIDANGQSQNSTDEKPRIVPLNELHQMIQRDACLLRSGDGLDGKFYTSLAQFGYVYDAETREWHRGTPRNISLHLMQSQYRIVNEIETQIVAENLSANEVEQLIAQRLDSSSVESRILIYSLLPRWKQLGLQDEQTMRLYRRALREVRFAKENFKAETQSLEWFIGDVYPLELFVETHVQLAINNQIISEDFSREVLFEMFQSSWLDSRIAQNSLVFTYRLSRQQNSANFEFALTHMLHKSYLDSSLAQRIYSQLMEADTVSSAIRLRILNQLIQKGIPFTENEDDWRLARERFSIGAQIENKNQQQALTVEENAELFIKIIQSASRAEVVSPLVLQFLSENSLSENGLRRIVDEFIKLTQRDTTPSAGIYTLAQMSFRIPMSTAQRAAIYRFVLLHFQNNENEGARNYLLFDMQYVSRQSPEVRASYQLLLELVAKSSRQKIGEVGLLPELEAMDATEARDLVRTIERCRYPEPSSMCEHITDPNRILSLIATNVMISEPTRQAARLELRWRH